MKLNQILELLKQSVLFFVTPSAYINEAPLSIITNYVILYQLPCMKWLKKLRMPVQKKVKLLMRNAQNAK